MRPMLKANMGEMGANLNLFLFPAQGKDGDPICPTTKKGSFTLSVDGRTYTYKTPLASLVPAKRCQKCQEECSGLWNYCPWCGNKLSDSKTSDK
ncbi:MAG: hypothetical protein NT028_10850 [candidate division Zixibacteria bacterium]|nr:hypothetical protein [candidate division Zixibacteria bacterium]